MFDDARSRRVVLVAHCLLNQNAKIDRCAVYPGAIREPAQLLLDAGVGLVQMPCPETLCLGLARGADPDGWATVAEEDTRVGAAMKAPESVRRMRGMAEQLVGQVLEYRRHGFAVLGVVGINESPTCAVETTWYDGADRPGPGAFIAILQELLMADGVDLPMRGVRAAQPAAAMAAVREILAAGPEGPAQVQTGGEAG